MAWNLKGIAHNRRGEYSLSQIAAAEVAIRKGDKAQAKIFIDRARKNLKTNSDKMVKELNERKNKIPKGRKNKHAPLVAMPVPDD